MSHETENEFADLALALREARPTPEPGFTERLDQAVEDHFPPEWASETALGRRGRGGIGNLAERFRRRMGGRRLLLPAVAGVASLLMLATVVAAGVESGRFGGGEAQDQGTAQSMSGSGATTSDSATSADSLQSGDASVDRLAVPESAMPANETSTASPSAGADATYGVPKPGNRDVALEAEITLGTDPDGVQEVANKVVEVTDDHNGIVMDSSVADGEEGRAGASFSLLIPSGQVESAVADLSGIADLRSRSQELTDITVPTNRAEDAVADSKAKIASLLGELEQTYDEDERAALEQRIRWERSDLRRAETRLNQLERRADYTPVAVRVETGGDSVSDDESSWGLSDAVDDAGKLLGVAAGVTLLALAVAIPIGIVVLIALAINRAWVRRSRHRALTDE